MRDMISVASGFQYSVNIGYDLGSDDKLKNFIPTKSALNLLENILLSTSPTSSDRARILIGAYGKGKSHIVLTILSLLMKRDINLFEKLMPKVQQNPRLYQLLQTSPLPRTSRPSAWCSRPWTTRTNTASSRIFGCRRTRWPSASGATMYPTTCGSGRDSSRPQRETWSTMAT